MLPPWIQRLLTVYLTEELARRLGRSRFMMYAADRLLHEMDHLPHRLQGRQVPPYVPPHFELPGERNFEDHGEPHDEPSPYPLKGQQPRQDAPENQQEARRAGDARARYPPRPETETERRSRELRELQEKLRGIK